MKLFRSPHLGLGRLVATSVDPLVVKGQRDDRAFQLTFDSGIQVEGGCVAMYVVLLSVSGSECAADSYSRHMGIDQLVGSVGFEHTKPHQRCFDASSLGFEH